MDPKSRGHAGVGALVLAVLILLGCLWIAFGAKAPGDGSSRPAGAREPVPAGPDVSAALHEADDLYTRLSKVPAPVAPADARFARAAPDAARPAEPPAVKDLRGEALDGAVVLRWETAGGAPAEGWQVERLAEDGTVLRAERLPAESRSFRDAPLDAIAGTRTYRVTALGPEGAAGGAEQRAVRYRLDVSLAYLGANADGRALFRVSAPGVAPQEFPVAAGQEIGEPTAAMDWRTGWKFRGLRALRQTTVREVDVPRFAPDGRLSRAEGSGEIAAVKRAVPVPVVSEGAVVLPPDTPDVERWLPRSKD